MASTFWEQVKANGLKVPEGRTLPELTTELTRMLGDPDPANRDGIAYPTLATWISQGVYDELLKGLGDGMATGLDVGLGEDGTDSVFRRSFSALVLAECIERDNVAHLVPVDTLLGWGDQLAELVRPRARPARLRAEQGLGAHGGARRRRAGPAGRGRGDGPPRADRAARRDRRPAARPRPTTTSSTARTTGWRMATMRILRRDLVGLDVLEPWVARLAGHARAHGLERQGPLPGQRQRAALPARALPPGRAGPEPAREPLRTCCSC